MGKLCALLNVGRCHSGKLNENLASRRIADLELLRRRIYAASKTSVKISCSPDEVLILNKAQSRHDGQMTRMNAWNDADESVKNVAVAFYKGLSVRMRTHRDRNTGYSCGTVVYTESSVHPVDASTLHTVALVDDLNLMLLATDSFAPVDHVRRRLEVLSMAGLVLFNFRRCLHRLVVENG
jgi:hypothetical protein